MTSEAISQWVIVFLSNLLNVDQTQIDTSLEFDDFGLDSRHVVGMVGELGDWLGRELDPGIINDHSSIKELSDHLATLTEEL